MTAAPAFFSKRSRPCVTICGKQSSPCWAWPGAIPTVVLLLAYGQVSACDQNISQSFGAKAVDISGPHHAGSGRRQGGSGDSITKDDIELLQNVVHWSVTFRGRPTSSRPWQEMEAAPSACR